MSAHWYTLHVKPHRERTVHDLLQSPESVSSLAALQEPEQPYEVFFPALRVKPVNPRSAKIRPYFPGYLFVYLDLDTVGPNALNWIPGAHGLVTFGDEPAVVPPHLIDLLKKRVADLAATGGVVVEEFAEGDPVRIVSGPFAGYEAIFDASLSGNERVQVLLSFLSNHPQKLKLDRDAIEKVNKNRRDNAAAS